MLRVGVWPEVVDLARAAGSAVNALPPIAGSLGWDAIKVADGDWLIDRARADEYCVARDDDEEFDPSDFLVGDDEDARDAGVRSLYRAGLASEARSPWLAKLLIWALTRR